MFIKNLEKALSYSKNFFSNQKKVQYEQISFILDRTYKLGTSFNHFEIVGSFLDLLSVYILKKFERFWTNLFFLDTFEPLWKSLNYLEQFH